MAYVVEASKTSATPVTVIDSTADGAIAITNAGYPAAGDHVGLLDSSGNAIVFEAHRALSAHIDVWCYDADVDLILQYLAGYTDGGTTEIWVDVGTETAITAAADETSASDVLGAITNLVDDTIRAGKYRIAAQLNTGTTTAYLHFFGVLK